MQLRTVARRLRTVPLARTSGLAVLICDVLRVPLTIQCRFYAFPSRCLTFYASPSLSSAGSTRSRQDAPYRQLRLKRGKDAEALPLVDLHLRTVPGGVAMAATAGKGRDGHEMSIFQTVPLSSTEKVGRCFCYKITDYPLGNSVARGTFTVLTP